jgi:hypothetical protein
MGSRPNRVARASRWSDTGQIVWQHNVYHGLGVLMRKGRIVRAYEWFLELPVTIVLVVLWLAGVGLVLLCALALYLSWIFFGRW